jgi:hypothetical protein
MSQDSELLREVLAVKSFVMETSRGIHRVEQQGRLIMSAISDLQAEFARFKGDFTAFLQKYKDAVTALQNIPANNDPAIASITADLHETNNAMESVLNPPPPATPVSADTGTPPATPTDTPPVT